VSKCDDSNTDAVLLNLSICSWPFSNFSKISWNTDNQILFMIWSICQWNGKIVLQKKNVILYILKGTV